MKKLKASSWFLCPRCTQAFTLRIKLKRHVESYHQLAKHNSSKSCRKKRQRDGDTSKFTTNEARKTRSRRGAEKARRDKAQAKSIATRRDGESSKVSEAAEPSWETRAAQSVKRFELVSQSPVLPALDIDNHILSSSNGDSSPQQFMGSTTRINKNGRESMGSSVGGMATAGSEIVADTSKSSSTESPAPFLQQRLQQATTRNFPMFISLSDHKSTEGDAQAPDNTCASPMHSTEDDVDFVKSSLSPKHAVECTALKQRLKCRKKFMFFGRNLKRRMKLPWKCPYCPVRFVSSLDFYQHIRCHKGETCKHSHSATNSKESKVTGCDNIDQRGPQLNQPESITLTEDSIGRVKIQDQKLSSDTEYKCPACSESFRQFSRISAHVQYDHNLSEFKALSWLVNHIADDYGSFQAYTEHQPAKGEALLRCTLCTTSDVLWERRLFWTHLTSFHNFSLGAAFHMSGSLKLKLRGTIEKRPEIGKTEMTVNTVGDNAAFNNTPRSSAVVLPPLNYFDTPAPLPADLMRLPSILQTARTQFAQRICPRVGD